ncbi:WD40 repeat domain-containing protein [Aeoliella sp. ICT_H6.2]|uniref:WD40 repeat domain-containing protein n=1 Tax=Aeoliella straminimaris TaxID=2954799 RepID=A0A9X2JIS2_9BACT|nr:WD40 repeat domain-containing protein [Aeoliella straminimaris]MCO6044249.1 WD40 repeat domain-containing protein [Aeoliella straminimaris]
MDAKLFSVSRRWIATLAIACTFPTLVTANEVKPTPVKVISFGDPMAVDANPQRRTAVVTAVVLSPDGQRLAAAGDDHVVRLFDVPTAKCSHQLRGHDDWIRGLSISSDGKTVVSAAADCCCTSWDSETGEKLCTTTPSAGPLRSVVFHPNGLQFAAAGYQCCARIFNLSGGHQSMQLQSPRNDYTCLAFSPDGATLAVGSADGTLRLFDATTGQLHHEIQVDTRRLRAVAFSGDGQNIACGGDGATVKIFSATAGTLVGQLPTRPAKVFCLKYLKNEQLAVGGSDNRVQIWRPEAPSLVKILEGHTGTITSLATDATGTLLASGSYDTTIRIWNLSETATPKTAGAPATATR